MIDKVFPRKLNSSKDARVRGKDEMIDAVNVTIDDNYDDFSNAKIESPSGNFGVLKPVKGNTAVENDPSVTFNSNGRVVGSCVDERNNCIYYFLAAGAASEQGVYMYKESDNTISPVITSNLFNFSTTSFIESNIVYIPDSTGSAGVKAILFFTDDINEPRKIDLSRISDGQALSDGDSVAFLDFISTCPRTPIDPPVASFENDPVVTVSNFKGKKGFQFAYQNIYKSGDISALSTYSKLYVPSAYIQQGTSPNASFYNENVLAVQIPSGSLTSEVERIRLLTREGNDGAWFIVDEIDYSGGTPQYNFYNDSVLTILPEAESRRQFDAVPKKARAQEVTNNRLFFGNYVEGFNVEPIDANITYETSDRPQDFITFELTLEAEVRQTQNPIGFAPCVNRVAGYRLSTSNLPDEGVEANTQIIFNVTLAPDNNFHFYESRGGYHGSARYNFVRPSGGGFAEEPYAQNIDDQVSDVFSKNGRQYFGTEQQYSLIENDSKFRKSGVGYDPYGESIFPDIEGQPLWRGVYNGEGDFFQTTSVSGGAGDLVFRGTPATYGTNAGNPFIIEGKPLKFSGSFVTLGPLSKQQLADAIRGLLLPPVNTKEQLEVGVIATDPLAELNINVLSRIATSTYNIDLGINNLDKLNVRGGADYRSKLVVAVGDQQQLLTTETAKYQNPVGYFIVNKAQPQFRLRDITSKYNTNTTSDIPNAEQEDQNRSEDVFFALDLVTLGDFETLTCIPDVLIDIKAGLNVPDAETYILKNLFEGWVCATPDWLQFQSPDLEEADWNNIFDLCGSELYNVTQGTFSFQNLVEPPYAFSPIGQFFTEFAPDTFGSIATQNYEAALQVFENNIKSWLGYIIPSGSTVTFTNDIEGYIASSFGTASGGSARPDKFLTFTGGRLINTFQDYVNSAADNGKYFQNQDDAYFDYAFSLVDGEAGAAGRITGSGANGMSRSSVSYQTIMCGVSPWCGEGYQTPDTIETRILLNNMPLINNIEPNSDIELLDFADMPGGFANVDPSFIGGASDLADLAQRKHAHIELYDFETTYIPPFDGSGEQPYKSFKTKANHDFGIVYYDQRGRASDVSPIGSVYVPGYNTFAAGKQGPVKVQINLEGQTPPSWAWNYQIVYGGNSTVDEFVQYSTGGAFVEFNSLDPDNNGNIYVSLNYLQHNNSVSYSEAFGAINSDGSKEFYTYKEGDKLRVISYFEASEGAISDPLNFRVFPDAYEFDVVGTVTLGDDSDNPLINPDETTPDACIGQFVILRNNPAALGFNYQSVQSGIQNNSPQPTTNQHFWNNGCIVEIYSPRKNQDAEDRVYYEVGKKYRVIRNTSNSGNPIDWENPNIVVTEGDVYFRRLPVNIPRYSDALNAYVNLIETGGSITPRFLDYFLETETFTDTIVGAKQHNWGKPKVVNRFQREIRRDSSITFGDVNNYSLPILRYGTFDATTSNFKDLPNTHGSIQKIVDRGDSIFIVQENKISDLPVSRTTLSDQAGNDIVVASTKAIGNQRFYAGDFGCSTNPESVTKIGENIYFANKEKFEVYKFNPANGVAIISEYGLKSYFYDLFKTAIDTANSGSVGPVRVVGGYDPLLDEFVISVHNDVIIAVTGVSEVLQEATPAIPDPYIAAPPTETVLGDELAAALAEIGSLESQSADYQQTITELQQTINSLYTQLGDVIGDAGEAIELETQIFLDDISAQIDELNDQAAVLEEGFIQSLREQNQFHLNIRNEAEEIRNNLVLQIQSYQPNPAGKAGFWQPTDTLVIPPILDLNIVQRAGADLQLGDEVDLVQYLAIMEEYKNEVEKYEGGGAPGLYDSTLGSYTLKSGNTFDEYAIGYGLPTTTADFTNEIPPDSILAQDPEFLTRWTGFGNVFAVGTPSDYGIRRECIILIDVLNGETFNLASGEIGVLETQVGDLEAEVQSGIELKRDLLKQIADLVEGVYEARVTRYNETDFLDPNTGQPPLRIFGAQYGSGADGEVLSLEDSPLKAMYDAVQDDDVNYTVLESLILDDDTGLRYSQIVDLIEQGFGTYSFTLDQEFNNQQAENTAIQVTRDLLATNFFNLSKYAYDVEKDVLGSTPSAQDFGFPPIYFSLVSGESTPTPENIITALDNQTIDFVSIDNTFPTIRSVVQEIANTGFTPDTGGSGEGLVASFTQSIADTLEVLRSIDAAVGYGGITEVVPQTMLDEIVSTDSQAVIQTQLETINNLYKNADPSGASLFEGPDGGIAGLVEDLKNLAVRSVTEISDRFFYDPTTANVPGQTPLSNIENILSGLGNYDGYRDRVTDLQDVVFNNIGRAIDDLYRFQILLTTPNLGTPIFTGAALGEPDELGNVYPADPSEFNSIVSEGAPSFELYQQNFPGVGFTGHSTLTKRGATASDVLFGKPIYNDIFLDGLTAYQPLKDFLTRVSQKIAGSYGTSDAVQNQETGVIDYLGDGSITAAFNSYDQLQGGTVPFLFENFDLRDVLPQFVLSTIQAEVEQQLIDQGLSDTPAVQSTSAVSSIIVAVANEVFGRNVEGVADLTIEFLKDPANQNAGGRADLDNDGSVGTNDLLNFLSFFGSSVDGIFTGVDPSGIKSLVDDSTFRQVIKNKVEEVLTYYGGDTYDPDYGWISSPIDGVIGQSPFIT